jgi:hypothetical protein
MSAIRLSNYFQVVLLNRIIEELEFPREKRSSASLSIFSFDLSFQDQP